MRANSSLSRNQLMLAGVAVAVLVIGLVLVLVLGGDGNSSPSSNSASALTEEESQTLSAAGQNLYQYCEGAGIDETELIDNADALAQVVAAKPQATVGGGNTLAAVAGSMAKQYSGCGIPAAGEQLANAIP